MHTRRVFLPICLVALITSGCAVNRYRGPVGNFRDKAQKSATVLADYYSARNGFEVDLYLNEVATDPTVEVLTKTSDGKPTPLGKPRFSPASIKARLDALDLIGVYANRLADLASSEAPSQFKDAGTLLGENLSSLSKTFSTLGGSADPTANKYVGPISNLIGAIGEIILERRRDELITAAVNKAAPQVESILTLIKDDLDNVFTPQATTGENMRFATLVTAYNNDRSKLTYEQRKQRLSEIKDASRARSFEIASAPSGLVTSMRDAHAALVKLAQSKRTPADFSAFNTALELWTSRIEFLAGQLQATLA